MREPGFPTRGSFPTTSSAGARRQDVLPVPSPSTQHPCCFEGSGGDPPPPVFSPRRGSSMRKALLRSLAAWLAGAGLALAQSATPVTVGAPTTPIAAPPARGTVPGPSVVTGAAGGPGP